MSRLHYQKKKNHFENDNISKKNFTIYVVIIAIYIYVSYGQNENSLATQKWINNSNNMQNIII